MLELNKPINILIMAVGSPLGQSILKAVCRSKLPDQIHVADINTMAAGLYVDNVIPVIFPLIKEPDYFQQLSHYLDAHQINVIFPTIAAEHDFFDTHSAYFIERGISIVKCSAETFRICNDKYQSMHFLQAQGINAPDTVLCANAPELERFLSSNTFPMVLKPRFGASSNDVFIVKNLDRLRGLINAFPQDYFILQTFLADPDDYTVGVFVSRDRDYKNTFILKRNLKFGLSYSGQVIENEAVSEHCMAIAEALQSVYSINVQLKLVDGVPFTYEINPRLSSTTSVRAHFGFNEPDMILRDLFNQRPLSDKLPASSGRFMRYWEEVYKENA